ncbi:MAG: MATE family efflux transporter [Clostridiales bacterium]|jgi:putative MATE family efflux protein|nr:MATE family efflux transporter [Clostridiales bacterium]
MEERELTHSEIRMASEPMRSLVIKYSIPTMLGMLVNSLYNIVDRYWVGQIPNIGNASLAGVGLSMPVINIIMALSMLVGVGAAARISIQLGRRDVKAAEETVANGLTMICVIAIAFSVLGVIFTPQILRIVGATDNLLPYALPYARIIIAGSFFNMASFAMNHPIRATGNPKRFAATQLVGGITNMILDPIFIFVFDMGINGAAIATVISQCVSASFVFSYYFTPNSALRFRIKNFKLKRQTMLNIVSIGMSPFFMQIANSVITIVANRSLTYYGKAVLGKDGDITAIGAMTVIGSINTLFMMPVIGINQGSQPIIGFNYGRRDAERVKSANRWAIIYAMIIAGIGLIVVQLFAEKLVWLFNKDEELIRTGASGMRILLCMLPIVGFQFPAVNFFQAIGRAKISILLSLLRQVIILIPAYLILPLFFGLTGVWMAGPLSDFTSGIIILVFLLRECGIIDKIFKEDDHVTNAE